MATVSSAGTFTIPCPSCSASGPRHAAYCTHRPKSQLDRTRAELADLHRRIEQIRFVCTYVTDPTIAIKSVAALLPPVEGSEPPTEEEK